MKISKTGLFIASLAYSLAALSATSAWAAAGPLSTLYAMNYGEFAGGTQTGMDMIQGLTVNSVGTTYPLGIDIAVYGDVRTMGYSTGDKGERFDLSGNSLPGGPYTNNIPAAQLHDGTTDGTYNYSVDYSTGDLIRFDRNWASPVTLFNVTSIIPGGGYLTMNAADGTFWVTQWGSGDQLVHLSPTGTLLASFNTGVNPSQGLAFDPLDGTLWMGDYLYNLHQFSQTGTNLQNVAYAVTGGGWYGMEFDNTPVPEPSSVVLAVLAAVGLGAACWRRR